MTDEVKLVVEVTPDYTPNDKRKIINENKKNVEFNNPIEILLLEQPEYYLLLVHEQDQTSGESSIHYTNYIKKGD